MSPSSGLKKARSFPLACGLATFWLLTLAIVAAGPLGCKDSARGTSRTGSPGPAGRQVDGAPREVPTKVGAVLNYIDEHHGAPKDYAGDRRFGNYEGLLPKKDAGGKLIKYREWDVDPKVNGKRRNSERLVTGSDGSAYYTPDHYKSFVKLR